MKTFQIFWFTILMHVASCHMPNVSEFCSHVVANGNTSQLTCDSSQCQGRPGKRGSQGPRGLSGSKGQKGEQGTAENLEERIRKLESSLAKTSQIVEALPKSAYCFMGMRNRDIPDSAIRASSIWDGTHNAYDGRLDNREKPRNYGAWAARHNRKGEWLQVDFGRPKLVGGIITQGRESYDQWVRSFKISCGRTTSSLATIRKIFTGNSDRDTKKINMFPNPITCRYIRVYPQSWRNHISIRVEFINGVCHDLYT
uniref:lactadherin-like n=1 Tax=Styela clava TaxID=7725 RepID=UPI00193998F5|nr:lactadherin-like [Styela clava]